MNESTRQTRLLLLRRYYKTAQLGWFHPKILHWAKIVTNDGYWKWIRADGGITRKLYKLTPVHVYQTILRFKASKPPRGRKTSGFLLGGPILFEADILDKKEPFSLWKLIDSSSMIHELIEVMRDIRDYRVSRVTFSGFRGIHVVFDDPKPFENPIPLSKQMMFCKGFKNLVRERKQLARSVGFRCKRWDWKVTADIWRVARVPWSIHGSSSLRAIPLQIGSNTSSLKKQIKEASPFSFSSSLNVRIKYPVPYFVFIDDESYGPYRKGWATKLPIAVALHLIWLDLARPRERGPINIAKWFERGWQIMFQAGSQITHQQPLSEGLIQ
jgi:hypothetical protein